MNLGAFYMAIYMSNAYNAEDIDDWAGIGKKVPVLSFFMVLSLASLAGLPPTSGFVSKVYILRNLFSEQQFMWLAVVAIINTVISLYYYFKIVKAMYFIENNDLEKKSCNPILYWSMIIFSIQNIFFYFYWAKIWDAFVSLVTNFKVV